MLELKIEKSFMGVALAIILVGATISTYGAVAWVFNFTTASNVVAFPSVKIIGGIVILALGYIVLELELLKRK